MPMPHLITAALHSVSSSVEDSASTWKGVDSDRVSEPATKAAVVLEQLRGYFRVSMCGKLVTFVSELALNPSPVREMGHGRCRCYS